MNLQLSTINAATATNRLIESVRLDGVRLSLISATDSGSNISTICFRWSGDRCPDICETGICNAVLPYIRMFRPPTHSLAGYWTTENTEEAEALFNIEFDSESDLFMDLHTTLVYSDGFAVAAGPALSAGASGSGIIVPRLNTMSPVGLTTATLA